MKPYHDPQATPADVQSGSAPEQSAELDMLGPAAGLGEGAWASGIGVGSSGGGAGGAASVAPTNGGPIDSIAEMERELARAVGVPVWSEAPPQSTPVPHAQTNGASSTPAGPTSARQGHGDSSLHTDPAAGSGTRGRANFRAWLETRRTLDGEGAGFEIEFLHPDGSSTRIDLTKVDFDDLPAVIQAEFEQRKFPDFAGFRFVSPQPSHEPPASEAASDGSNTDAAAATQRSADWARSTAPRPGTSSVHAAGASEMEDSEDAARTDRHERVRAGPTQSGFGFGLGLGGMSRKASRAAQGRPPAGGGPTTPALAQLRKGLGALVARPRKQIGQHVQRWREQRASAALESLEQAGDEFQTSLAAIRAQPQMVKVFRAWHSAASDSAREQALRRFAERFTGGHFSAAIQEQVAGLFGQAERVRERAARALKCVEAAGQPVDSLQRSVRAWFKTASEQAGPLCNSLGESLAEKLNRMAEHFGRAFEKLVERLARLSALRTS